MKSFVLKKMIANNAVNKILKSEKIVELNSAEIECEKIILKRINSLSPYEREFALKRYGVLTELQAKIDSVRLGAIKSQHSYPRKEVDGLMTEYEQKWQEIQK